MSFVWTLNVTAPARPNWAAFLGGRLSVGGGAWVDIIGVTPTLSELTTSTLRIPLVANDDDVLTQLPYPITGLNPIFVRAYEDAYIESVMAPMGHNVTAAVVRNLDPADLGTVQESQMDTHRADAYWVAYVLWSWQFYEDQDYDPNNEKSPVRGSGRGYTLADRWSSVAIGSSRDSFLNGVNSANWAAWGYASFHDLAARTAAHEVGHQFGFFETTGGAANLMWYAEGPVADTQHFLPIDLDALRDRITSPGR